MPQTAPQQTNQFEARFAELARQILQDRSPLAAQREVGFQLVERNEEGNRACGVFGIDLNGELALAPVFFIDGETKADHLVHTKPDLYAPLTDDWVKASLRKDPNTVGSGVDRNETLRYTRQVDLRNVMDPAYRKSGAKLPNGPDQSVPASMLPVVRQFLSGPAELTFDKVAKEENPCKNWAEYVQSNPEYRHAFSKLAIRYPAILPLIDAKFGEGSVDKMLKGAASVSANPVPSAPVGATAPVPPAGTIIPPPSDASLPGPTGSGPVMGPIHGAQTEGDMDGILGRAQDLYNQHMPEWLPPGRLALGLGAAAGGGALLGYARNRRRNQQMVADSKDELDAETVAKFAAENNKPSAALAAVLGDDEAKGRVDVLTPAKMDKRRKSGLRASPGEVQDVAQKGYSVTDTRKSAATVISKRALTNAMAMKHMTSPTKTGTYEMAVRDGDMFKTKKVMVMFPAPRPGAEGAGCLVVDPTNDEWCLVPAKDLLVLTATKELTDPMDEYRAWAKGLPKAGNDPKDSVEDMEPDSSAPTSYANVVVYPDMDGRAWGPYTGCSYARNGAYTAGIYNDDYAGQKPSAPLMLNARHYDNVRIENLKNSTGIQPQWYGGTLLVPQDTRTLKLDTDKKTLQPARPAELIRNIETSAVALKTEKAANDRIRLNHETMSKSAALVSLMVEWDLPEKQAQEVLESADSEFLVIPPRWMRDAIKEAATPIHDMGIVAPQVPDPYETTTNTRRNSFRTFIPDSTSETVQMPDRDREWDGQRAEDEQLMKQVFRNNDSGVEDEDNNLFSTTGIAAMLNEVDGSIAVDRGIADMIKAMDRLGKTLFLARWHDEAFEERYGEKDAQAVEDLVRTNFLQLGKTILRLRQKGIGQLPNVQSV